MVERSPPKPAPVKSEAAGGGGLKGQTLQVAGWGGENGNEMRLQVGRPHPSEVVTCIVAARSRVGLSSSGRAIDQTAANAPASHDATPKLRKNHPLDWEKTQKEDVAVGLENAPKTLLRLFAGQNFGKQLLKIADAPLARVE
jgi:hypothetical protein